MEPMPTEKGFLAENFEMAPAWAARSGKVRRMEAARPRGVESVRRTPCPAGSRATTGVMEKQCPDECGKGGV